MSQYVDEFRAFIKSNIGTQRSLEVNPRYANPAQPHVRLTQGQMRDFVQGWAKQHKNLSYQAWRDLLDALYHGTTPEEKVLPGFLLAAFPKLRQGLNLNDFESWLAFLDGWREVDNNCQAVFTYKEMAARWDEWQVMLSKMATSTVATQRRASIVLLILPARETDDARVFDLIAANIAHLAPEKDILISKAVSWVLREAVKKHRSGVEQLLVEYDAVLPKVTVREVRTKLETGKKVKRLQA